MSDRYRIRIDASKTSAEFKLARRLLRAKATQGVREALSRTVLPVVKAASPSVVSPYVTTKSRSTNGYVTTKGPKVYDRITGLLNFGGLVSTKIVPKKKQALHLRGTNVFVSQVGNGQRARGRRYRGKKFLERGVRLAYPAYERTVTKTVMSAFGELAE